jgi:hypothetical protein
MKKNLTKTMKKDLQFLVEEFLEKFGDKKEIKTTIGGRSDVARILWTKLERPLFGELPWMDEVDPEDMAGVDYEKLLIRYHEVLKPIWDQFRNKLFDYKYCIIPAREDSKRLRKTIDKDKSSPIFEYKELFKQQNFIYSEKIFDIVLGKSFKRGALTVSFDSGRVTFYQRDLDVINNFLDLLQGVPVEYFAKCNHCGKCIILTRSNKQFCPGCAAKKNQKDKWASDPEGMKAKEKLRYDRFRKRK